MHGLPMCFYLSNKKEINTKARRHPQHVADLIFWKIFSANFKHKHSRIHVLSEISVLMTLLLSVSNFLTCFTFRTVHFIKYVS